MGPGEHLDVREQLAVGGHGPMVVAVGAHELGEHARVTPVGLDADDHVGRFLGVLGDEGMQASHALEALGDASGREHPSLVVAQAHGVVRLGPVDADEDHRCPLLRVRSRRRRSRRANGPVLSSARHPSGHLDRPRRPPGARSRLGTLRPATASAHPVARLGDQSDGSVLVGTH